MVDGRAAWVLVTRLTKLQHESSPRPWERHGTKMVMVGPHLVAHRWSQRGLCDRIVIQENYQWDPERELLPGAECWQMIEEMTDAELAQAGGKPVQLRDGDLKSLPTLAAFLSQRKFPSGKARTPGKLTTTHDGEGWLLMLQDRTYKLVAFIKSDSLAGAHKLLEAALAAKTIDWREDKYQTGGGGQRKK